ncbi:MAG: hypothetical protein Q8M97_11370 [Methanobacteriaceae archaeon]|nr:hypothetical protein [Methanobacteriaceae archaeon]
MVNSKGSEYPGVWKEGEEWGSYIMIKGENIHLGDFKIEEHAAMAYLMAKSESKLKKDKAEKVSELVRGVKFKQNERGFYVTDPELIEILKKLVNELEPRHGENIKITLEKVKG